MLELFLNLLSQFFNRQRNFDDLCDALEKYQEDEKSLARQLRLEAAFYDVFKKRATAKLIRQVASTDWGPRESMRVFGQSSQNVRCNFTTHKLEIVRLNKWLGRWLPLVQFLNGVVIYASGVTLIIFSSFILYQLTAQMYFTKTIKLHDLSFPLFAEVFMLAGGGFLSMALGVLFIYVSWKGIGGMESDNKAFTLKRLLSQQDNAH